MTVFLSWSGEHSRRVATALRKALGRIFPGTDFWLSSEDIDAGHRWIEQLSPQLESTDFGILCLDPTNTQSAWLLFEAGALAKRVERARVVPYCLGLNPGAVHAPLSQFQGVAADKRGTFKLITSINKVVGMKNSAVSQRFTKHWPALAHQLAAVSEWPRLQSFEHRLFRTNEESQEGAISHQALRESGHARYLVVRGRRLLSADGEIAFIQTQKGLSDVNVQVLLVDVASANQLQFERMKKLVDLNWRSLPQEKKDARKRIAFLEALRGNVHYKLLPPDVLPDVKLHLYDRQGFFTFYTVRGRKKGRQLRPMFGVADGDPMLAKLRDVFDRLWEANW